MESESSQSQDPNEAPEKERPHLFEAVPDVPIVFPRTGIEGQQGLPGAGMGNEPGKPIVCQVCGRPESDRLHVQAEDAADAESTSRWPL